METRPEPEKRKRTRSGEQPQVLRWVEFLQAAGILFMVTATPWLFGTTEDWAIRLMNWVAYGLGGILVIKRILTFIYRDQLPARESRGKKVILTWGLNLLICSTLVYILISAINARASFVYEEQSFIYHEGYRSWLPHSYDSAATWALFWQYLGMACFFWCLRDWLITDPSRGENEDKRFLTRRLKLLLWVICLNGSLVALQAILQRLSGSSKLLWVRESYWKQAAACFGSYSYRSNAAQYLNLIWPVTVGFWLVLRTEFTRRNPMARGGEGAHLVLIPLAAVTALGPLISLSRGGAMVAALLGALILALILFSKRLGGGVRIGATAIFIVILALGGSLGWPQLKKRLAMLENDSLGGRVEIYENTKKIAADFPKFGTGAGSFAAVYQLYRESSKQVWQSTVHDDWLETRVTLGWVGFLLVLGIMLLTLLSHFAPGGLTMPSLLSATMFFALIGCLIHAKFDFPFQIYSILLLFITYCGILSGSSFRGRGLKG